MASLGDLVINISARTQHLTKGLNLAQRQLQNFTRFAGMAAKSVVALGATGATALGGLSVLAVKLAADAEQTAIAFEVLTGSAQTGQKLIQDLRRMGAKTPFEFTGLADAGRTLLAFGRNANQVQDDLDMLSNVAAGDANKLSSLALVFGQISANARLTGGDLLQLINVGFNPLQQIAERTGETMMQLRDRMSKGKIGFEEVRQAFKDATSEGGRFHKMNERMSETLLGKWSTLKDTMTEGLIEIGEALAKNLDLSAFISGIQRAVESIKKDLVPAIQNALSGIDKEMLRGQFMQEFAEKHGTFELFKMGPQSAEFEKQFEGWMKDKFQPGVKGAHRFNPEVAKIRESNLAKKAAEDASAAEQGKRAMAERQEILGPLVRLLGNRRDALGGWAKQGIAGAREGVESLLTGVMSLLPQKRQEQFTNQVGVLEKGSMEAFAVMRANTGGGEKDKMQQKQLDETKKQTKLLAEVKTALKEKAKNTFQVKGYD